MTAEAIAFAAALGRCLSGHAETDAGCSAFAQPLLAAARAGGEAAPAGDGDAGTVAAAGAHARPAHIEDPLARALDAVPAGSGAVNADLADAVRAVAPLVTWYAITRAESIKAPWDPSVARLMAASLVVGPAAPLLSEAVRAGLFLLLPGLHYPAHTHASDEVYLGLSGTVRISHGLPPATEDFDLGPGRASVTPPHRLHSLTPGDTPVLLAYAWTGPFNEPIFWWRDDGGAWLRTRWQRGPDSAWIMGDETPASGAEKAEATGT